MASGMYAQIEAKHLLREISRQPAPQRCSLAQSASLLSAEVAIAHQEHHAVVDALQ